MICMVRISDISTTRQFKLAESTSIRGRLNEVIHTAGDYMVPLDREFAMNETQVAMNTYRYGMLVSIEGGGKISSFALLVLVRTIVEGFVLGQASTVLIQYVAMCVPLP